MIEIIKTGWWNPNPFDTRSKFHYAGEDGVSLCRKYRWMLLNGEPEEGQINHPDNCEACRKKKKNK